MLALRQRQHPRDAAFIHTRFGGDEYGEHEHHRHVGHGANHRRNGGGYAADGVQNLRAEAFDIFCRYVESGCSDAVADGFNLRFDNSLKAGGLRGKLGSCEYKCPIHETEYGKDNYGQADAARDGQHPAKQTRTAIKHCRKDKTAHDEQ